VDLDLIERRAVVAADQEALCHHPVRVWERVALTEENDGDTLGGA